MIRRILHPSDFSPASRAAFAKALELAKQNRGQVIIAHVLAPILPVADGYMSSQAYAQMEAANGKYGKKQLDALIARAKRAGVRARGLLLDGIASDRIVRAAKANHADVIVMGTHGRTGLARFFLGSVASRVVGHASCPVLTVRGR
jgi:nucleotide-binding universal stress UspA family protein